MTDTFRAMCAELVRRWDTASCDHDLLDVADAMDRARALLAQPEPAELTDEELVRLAREWNSGYESIELEFIADFARAVLARWGRPTPQPPADGEVAELVEWLRSNAQTVQKASGNPANGAKQRLTRIADLLQRQHPQPVPVSERPWEREGWCDAEGRCWLRRKHEEDGVTWRLMAPSSVFDDAMPIYYAEALPARALPVPAEKVQS